MVDKGAFFNMLALTLVHCERGDRVAARALLTTGETLRDSDSPLTKAGHAAFEARVLRAEGRYAEALASAERGLAYIDELTLADTSTKLALVEAIEAALAIDDLDKAETLLAMPESLDPGQLTPFAQAQSARLRARLDAARGETRGVDDGFRKAAGILGDWGMIFHAAVTRLDHAEWLAALGRHDDAQRLLVEAGETFEQLRATPWLERVARLSAVTREPAAAAL